jgi:hypothetical protein
MQVRFHTRPWLGMGVLAATVCVLSLLAAPPAPGEGKAPEQVFPSQDYRALPGKVIGVLASNGAAVLSQEGRQGPADALCLGSGPGSYRWLYVPVAKKPQIGGLNVRVGDKGKATKRFDSLSMASPATVQQWSVTQPYTLVEVEVNSGLGAPPGENFVATGMRVLEGSRDYPFKTTEVVNRLRTGYLNQLKGQEQALAQTLTEARKGLPPGRKSSGVPERTELLYVTWLPEQERLRLVIQTRITETAPGPVPPAGPGQPLGRRPATLCGAEWGMSFEVSRLGKLEQSQELPLRKVLKEVLLPPPPPPEKEATLANRRPKP